jgi:hypothetical protein
MRDAVQEYVGRSRICWWLSSEAFLPVSISGQQLLIPDGHGRRLEPCGKASGIEMNEGPLSKLLDCGQAIGVTRYRRAANAQLDIFNIAIWSCRRRLKSCESIKA